MRADWPSAEDLLPRVPGEPDGWHVRETTELDGVPGYPLMGSSPAERAEAVERMARIKAQAMRTHPFEGEGPYCQRMLTGARHGSVEVGFLTMTVGCGYPRDAHPEEVDRP